MDLGAAVVHDWQMLKTQEEGVVNLALGEPGLLQEKLLARLGTVVTGIDWAFEYPQMSGNQDLLDELKLLHPGKHVVVTVGAKQGLLASLWAYNDWIGPFENLRTMKPYWPSYPTIAKLSGMGFSAENPIDGDCLTVNTFPNNPDGVMSPYHALIWDAAYAHRIYGFNGPPPPHGIAVYSAAKLFGLAGSRVGWIVTEERELADRVSKYVELTTSGVANFSQSVVANLLKVHRTSPQTIDLLYDSVLADARLNAMAFWQRIAPLCLATGGSPNGLGMFAFFKVKQPKIFEKALERARVRLVTGEACGMKSRGWYRMNTFVNSQQLISAVDAIHNYYQEVE